MKHTKRIIAAILSTLTLLLVVAGVAQALNVYNQNYHFCSGSYGYYNTWRIYDYNSYEESWWGGSKRDYRVFVGQYRDPGMDGYCRGVTVYR